MAQPELTIEQGKLRGSVGHNIKGRTIFKFRGIPYAKPPLGELRFKAPQPPDKWSSVFDATKEGDASYQKDALRNNLIFGSENCLVLNVYTKQLPDNINKVLNPVMVWIHGGGFVFGSSSEEFFGPEFLLSEEVLLVTFNYRLGMLGFLNFEDTSLEVPGNAGFKDMIMALKWIQKNISKFGGDPHNVTIFGESAGGASVNLLFLSPLGKGLFHKVIGQSGCAINPWVRGVKGAYRIAEILKMHYDEKKILEKLRKKTVEEIFEIQDKIVDDIMVASEIRPWGLVIESTNSKNAFLTKDPFDILLTGMFPHLPYMTGFTTGEGQCVEVYKPPKKMGVPSLDTYVPWYFGYDHNKPEIKVLSDKIQKFYFKNEEPVKNIRKLYDLSSDSLFIYGVYETIMMQYDISKAPTFVYRVSIETELNVFKKLIKVTEPGVSHCDDVGYLFKGFMTPEVKPNSIEDIGRTRFIKLWTNFATFGNPTPDKNDKILKVVWKPVTNSELDFLDIGKELKLMSNPNPERIQFWKSIYADSPAFKKLQCASGSTCPK